MQLKCKKSVIDVLKQINKYYIVKASTTVYEREYERIQLYGLINRFDDTIARELPVHLFQAYLRYYPINFVYEAQLYELLKTEFKNDVFYSYGVLMYEPSHTNLSIHIAYPYDSDKTKLWLIILDATKSDVAREDFDNIKDLTDIVDILKQVRDKYDN
jgi:hypothetical protein